MDMDLSNMDSEELMAEYNKLEEKKKQLADEFSKLTAGETIAEATSKAAKIGIRNHWREAGNYEGDMEKMPYTHKQIAMIDKYNDLKHKQQEIIDYADIAGF